MNNRQRTLNLFGLAQRAGKLVSGEALVLQSVRSNKAKIVCLASDASNNTSKQFLNKCEYYNVPLVVEFTREELSHTLGKDRTVCALIDDGFKHSLQKLL
ncbi:MAG: ribosomal L7Ae/L30e/S12e/Gadd45 family protein [Alkalibacterium sp.]|uniref:LSU ribosomal protein L7AE n=1 Tax=Alkalibacterium gilvum TaxID=1130080 RepID=A0A1H6R3P7_9LACT|nr:ribosomal L7Ae/L30e/S12e/Gadd45 family protein [Alkalibacterium gilvum]MDN6193496.1 ribosomal L7Ae/L30e/S12e/Gadd45 family protein [Alkalibacterium sp.]MDN6327401.1 ribosomal L7Ae/L30e/S12e/Gadd45 family protein [Alkalibacterium sp.]MDN6728592.1 ribosomal L7Ae/L30e/S12e/Gadd45 family protein [Alkalibacterium sp.]SEI49066.1 LSU ribosomal protein L7AE [Alkalibacterium gilvum]